jgi:hypothetical protein
MALSISIEGTGVIADCDNISDNQGGTWFELGGGSIAQSTDVYFIRSASIGGKYAAKSGVHAIDKGSGLYDFTSGGAQEGELVYMWLAMTAPGTLDIKSNYGLCIRLSSGSSTTATSNYVDFLIAGSDDANGWDGGWRCFVIDPTMTPTRYNGTISSILASVRSLGVWIDCSGSARADSIFINEIAIGKGLRVTGTSTTGWKDVVDYCTTYSTRGWGMWQQREGIYYSYGKTYIGDSTSQSANVSFEDQGRVIQFGTSEYWNGSSWVSSMPTDASGIVIEDISGYTTTFTDGVIVGSNNGRSGSLIQGNSLLNVELDLYGGANAGSLTALYGTTIKNVTGFINSGNDADHKFFGCSFLKSVQFNPIGAPQIRNCIFAETSDADAALLWNENINVQNCNFIANTNGAAIEMPSDVGTPYAYTALFFSGNTYDVLNSSGSAITINKNSQSDPSTYEGSSVSFSATFTFTVTGLELNTEVTIVTSGTSTVLYNVENATTSDGTGKYQITYTHSGGATVDILIHHIDYKPDISNIYAVTLPSSNSSAKVKMFLDENYENP